MLVAFVSAVAGFACMAVYVLLALNTAGLKPADKNGWQANLILFEGLIVLVSVTALVGRILYRLLKARSKEIIVRREIGGYAVILKVLGMLGLAGGMIARWKAGQPLTARDAASFAVMAALLLWAIADWYYTPGPGPGDDPAETSMD